MKNVEQNQEPIETDQDAAWRERIQRALRDLRSGSSIGQQPISSRSRSE